MAIAFACSAGHKAAKLAKTEAAVAGAGAATTCACAGGAGGAWRLAASANFIIAAAILA